MRKTASINFYGKCTSKQNEDKPYNHPNNSLQAKLTTAHTRRTNSQYSRNSWSCL